MLRREVVKMAGSLFGLGAGTPSRYPYPDRPQPSPGIGPGAGQPVRTRQVIVSGSGPSTGIFVYNGTPGLGTLVQSITSPATFTDPFGNAIIGTNTTYQKLSPTSFQAVAYQGNEIIFFTATSPAGPWASTGLFISFSASGPDGILFNASGGTVQLGVLTTGVRVSGTSFSATAGLSVTGGTTTDTETVTGKLTATGGTSGAPSLVTTDSWHQVGVGGFSAFVNGWTSPGAEHLDVTLNADNTVTVAGRVNNVAGTAGNSLVCTLPAPYQTANRVEFGPADQTNAAVSHTVQLDTAGNLQVNGAVAAGGIVSVQARFPLGAPA